MDTRFYAYIPLCSDSTYYTGHTDDIEKRLAAHHVGGIPGYTFSRRPVRLVFMDEVSSRDEAFARERQIKDWSRAKKEALIERDWIRLKNLARTHGSTGMS